MEKLIIATLLKNTAMVVYFALLAVHFDKWWIVLFSALFLSELKSKTPEEKAKSREEKDG